MATIGVITAAISGHMLPTLAQADALRLAGHRLRFYQIPDVRERIESRGFDFVPIGEKRYPLGSFARMREEIAGVSGYLGIKRSLDQFLGTHEAFLKEFPGLLDNDPVDLLIIDQIEMAAALVAKGMQIPYVTTANALPSEEDPLVPPTITSWMPGGDFAIRRNRAAYRLMRLGCARRNSLFRQYERRFGVPSDSRIVPYLSELASIDQVIPGFDFPRSPSAVPRYQLGAMRSGSHRQIEFDWNWLDGRPLIYASLGTTVSRQLSLLTELAESVRRMNVQMVLSMGGRGEPEELGEVPENVLVVRYAPQPELIEQASLVVTHGGLNTTMESLAKGKPLVAIPISYEQPGVAARIRYAGCGEWVHRRKANRTTIRDAIRNVMESPRYAIAADKLRAANAEAGGAAAVVEIVGDLVSTH